MLEMILLDAVMLAVLGGCCGLLVLLMRWCKKQVDSNE